MKEIARQDDQWLWPFGGDGIGFIPLNGHRGMKPGVEFEFFNFFTKPPHHIFCGGDARLNDLIGKTFGDDVVRNPADVSVQCHFFFCARLQPAHCQLFG